MLALFHNIKKVSLFTHIQGISVVLRVIAKHYIVFDKCMWEWTQSICNNTNKIVLSPHEREKKNFVGASAGVSAVW